MYLYQFYIIIFVLVLCSAFWIKGTEKRPKVAKQKKGRKYRKIVQIFEIKQKLSVKDKYEVMKKVQKIMDNSKEIIRPILAVYLK